jgi:hypothetical protein
MPLWPSQPLLEIGEIMPSTEMFLNKSPSSSSQVHPDTAYEHRARLLLQIYFLHQPMDVCNQPSSLSVTHLIHSEMTVVVTTFFLILLAWNCRRKCPGSAFTNLFLPTTIRASVRPRQKCLVSPRKLLHKICIAFNYFDQGPTQDHEHNLPKKKSSIAISISFNIPQYILIC